MFATFIKALIAIGILFVIASLYLGFKEVSSESLAIEESGYVKTTAVDEEVSDGAFREVITKQLSALKKGDLKAAYEGLVTKEFREITPFDQFREFVERYPILHSFDSFSITEPKESKDKATAVVILKKDDQVAPVEYLVIKENGGWLVQTLRLILPEAYVNVNSLDGVLIKVVKDQLTLLNQGNVQEAYDGFVSERFKSATTLDQFKKFLKKYPILTNNESAKITKGHQQGDVAQLVVELIGEDEETVLEYTLHKKGDKWEVEGLQLYTPVEREGEEPSKEAESSSEKTSSFDVPDFDAKPLQQTIDGFMELVRKGKYEEAYNRYASYEFKEATALGSFLNFAHNQLGISQNESYTFDHLTFNNNIGTYTGTLIDKQGNKYDSEIDLIKERKGWRILHMEVKPAASKQQADKAA